MSIYVVSSDEAVQTVVNFAVEDHFPDGDRLRELFVWQRTDRAEAQLRVAQMKGRMPDALLLDTDARAGPDSPLGGARTAAELLATVTALMPDLPIVLAVRSAGAEFDVEAVLRKQVWTWDMKASGSPEERLAAVLRAAVARPERRHLCATIRFERDAEYLDIHENGVPHLTARPLLQQTSDELLRGQLHRYADEDLEVFVNSPDIGRCWDKLGDTGRHMFVSLFGKVGAALFGKDGAALLQRDAPVTIEFRFEITRSLLKERFGLPFELLTRSGTRNEFLCRTLPMARRVGAVAPVPAASVERPHVLFVDAGAAQGQSDVLDEHVLKPAGFPPLQATAEQQFGALDAFAQAGHCTVERWNVAAFRRDYPENAEGTTFLEALRHRLQEPRPGHQQVDILHFSGHGVTPRSSETRLVVPGAKDKTVELLRIGRLAGWLPKSVRLVFLGACQSISASTAEHLHGALRCSVVGFRWEIRAERIPAFAKEFYRAHLADQRSVAAAYRAACHETADDVHTVWASAVALTAD